DEGTRERRQNLLRQTAERKRTTKRTDRLAGALVQKQCFAETSEELGRGHALLRVLDADAKDLFGLLDLADVHASGSEQTQALCNETARFGREHLPFRRAEEDRERRRPRTEERDDLRPLLLQRASFGLGDLREIDRRTCTRGDAIELFAHVRANAQAECIEVVLFFDAVVE